MLFKVLWSTGCSARILLEMKLAESLDVFFFRWTPGKWNICSKPLMFEEESLMWIYHDDGVMMLDKINNILKCEKIHTFAELWFNIRRGWRWGVLALERSMQEIACGTSGVTWWRFRMIKNGASSDFWQILVD